MIQKKSEDLFVQRQVVEENKLTSTQQQEIIDKTASYVQRCLDGEASGHDWWHAYRVWMLAKEIGQQEGVNMFVVELAALLHDIADWKFHGGDETIGPKTARAWLERLFVAPNIIEHICDIIKTMSFKGAGVETPMKTLEGNVVQDADRLDAIGAIGIARCFAYGGAKGLVMYDPEKKVELHQSVQAYKNCKSPSLNHFYEKLFLVKERINTHAGHVIAKRRHEYMKQFVETFLREWEGISSS